MCGTRVDSLHTKIHLWDTSQHPQTIRHTPFFHLFDHLVVEFILFHYLEQFGLGIVRFGDFFAFADGIALSLC